MYLQVMRAEKRILDSDTGESAYYYHIHFAGRGKQYDTWMEESDLYKFNTDLISGVSSEAADASRKRAEDKLAAKRAELRLTEIPQQLRLRMPPALKQVVVDDYDMSVHKGMVLPVPRHAHEKPTVKEIIKAWKKKKLDSDDMVEDDAIEDIETIAESLIEYFDNAAYQFLLYHNELELYDMMQKKKIMPSDAYGAEHLVRLIVKLPELVSVAMMALPDDAKYIIAVEEAIQDLMGYISSPHVKGTLFSGEDAYVQKAMLFSDSIAEKDEKATS